MIKIEIKIKICSSSWLNKKGSPPFGRLPFNDRSWSEDRLVDDQASFFSDRILDEIRADFIKLFRTKTRDEWFELLKDKDIEIGKVYSIAELMNDPQIRHRQMIIEIEHPTEGMIKQTGIPIKLSATPGKIRRPSPSLGENTEEIMVELGYNQSDVNQLRQEGVVAWTHLRRYTSAIYNMNNH